MAIATRSVKKNRRLTEKPGALFELPAPAAFRNVARMFLAELREARQRLEAQDDKDDAALHDFRVALRRLRSTIRLYRPVVGRSAIPRKARRSLKRFARITAEARDAEVSLAWLRATCNHMNDEEKVACNAVVADWETRRNAAYKNVRRRLKKKFAPTYRRADKALSPRAIEASGPTLARTVGKLLNRQIGTLASELERIRSIADAPRIHKARIEGKRLRYLLEPLAAEIPQGNALLDTLKQFQDRFGGLCDRQILSAELIELAERHEADGLVQELRAVLGYTAKPQSDDRGLRSGLLTLARRLRAEREERFGEIEREYRGERLEAFLGPFRTLAEETGPSAPVAGATAGVIARQHSAAT